jgi:predicted transporter
VSKRALIVIVVVAISVGIMIGYCALPQRHALAISARDTGGHDDAAKAASRAMTFMQPKAPAQ